MTLSRRGVLDFGLAAAALALPAAGPAALDPAAGPEPGDALVAAEDPRRARLRPEDLPAGAPPLLAWPMARPIGPVRDGTRWNLALLLRLPAGGIVAYSAICQHAGCVVSGWLAAERLLLCPCHGSRYDPARLGAVVAGPAPLPLPRLPVRATDGVIEVTGPFSARVGGHAGRTD